MSSEPQSPESSREWFLAKPARSIPEVAIFLKMPHKSVRQLADDGTFPGIKLGKQWRLSTRGVVRVIDAETTK